MFDLEKDFNIFYREAQLSVVRFSWDIRIDGVREDGSAIEVIIIKILHIDTNGKLAFIEDYSNNFTFVHKNYYSNEYSNEYFSIP